MKASTLIISDLQHDFMPGGALSIPGANEIVPIINALIPKFKHVLAVRDWHPQHHVSFASTHHRSPGETIQIGDLEQVLWPDHCVQHTRGAKFARKLNRDRIEAVFHKGTDPQVDSYSVFFDNAQKRSTGLADYLNQNNLTQIYLTGLTTEYCILRSVQDAIELKFKPSVIVDACRPADKTPGDGDRALEKMKSLGAKLVHSNDL